MNRIEYTGLTTTRITVECSSLMDTSNARISVKTNTDTKEWFDEPEQTLGTAISSEDPWSIQP